MHSSGHLTASHASRRAAPGRQTFRLQLDEGQYSHEQYGLLPHIHAVTCVFMEGQQPRGLPAHTRVRLVGVLAPDAHSSTTLSVRGLSHAQADAQVMRPARVLLRGAGGMDQVEAGSAAQSQAAAAGLSWVRVSHSVLLAEVWEVVEQQEEHGEQGERAKREEGEVWATAGSAGLANTTGSSRPEARGLQAIVTDLPVTDPRQCVDPK